ncbi:MAG: site-2 protease family protein [Burkholderiaceae bacterium]|jgi:Zn-dependent protease|nr:site-2 protease family protein [Burkholderiaceae bacterium]
MDEIIYKAAVWALPLIFAITLHEAAHAYVARFFGDPTAYLLGRVSLNPIRHIDLLGTIVIPAALFLLKSPFIFGYAKPVPVRFDNLRNPRPHSAMVALAGPAANLLMAVAWTLFNLVCLAAGLRNPLLIEMASGGVLINLALFAFNLFPLPPLDGGRILLGLLPVKMALPFSRLERYGFFIVLALLYLNVLNYWMVPLVRAGAWFIRFVFYPVSLFIPFIRL